MVFLRIAQLGLQTRLAIEIAPFVMRTCIIEADSLQLEAEATGVEEDRQRFFDWAGELRVVSERPASPELACVMARTIARLYRWRIRFFREHCRSPETRPHPKKRGRPEDRLADAIVHHLTDAGFERREIADLLHGTGRTKQGIERLRKRRRRARDEDLRTMLTLDAYDRARALAR